MEIVGAEVNLKANTVLISGRNFGSTASSLVVQLFAPMQGEVQLIVADFDAVTGEILALFPPGIPPGTFRLTVSKPSDLPDFDHFDVSFDGPFSFLMSFSTISFQVERVS